MVRILCLAFLIMVLSIPAGHAQDKADTQAVPAGQAAQTVTSVSSVDPVVAAVPVAATAPVAVSEAVMEFKMSKTGNVSLDFREADIKNVLKVLSYKSGINIIAGPEVVGMVNIQLKDVPWQKALDVILSTYGYSYEQKGTIIMVTTVENLKKRREDAKALADQEPIATKTFVLNFSKAADVVASLDKMKTARGSINFDKRTNAVIVSDVESNLELITEVVKTLDTVTPQVLIEARIIKTGLTKSETMGIDWSKLTQVSGKATFGTRPHSFPWSPNKDMYLPAMGPAATAPVITYGTLSITDLSLVIDALQSRGNTKSISNPQLVTMDNQPARIQVGDQYPMPQYSFSSQTNTMVVSGWSYIDLGVIFNVTPHINNASLITLELEPQVSSISDKTVTVLGTTMPVLTNEAVKTMVMIRDGETLVIAGLISEDKTISHNDVPFLGWIPILGIPFRHKAETVNKSEMLIFLTPHIITPTMESVSAKSAKVPVPAMSPELSAAVEEAKSLQAAKPAELPKTDKAGK